jgi:thioredoxin 1
VSIFESVADTEAFDAAVGDGGMVIAKFQTKACVICRRLEPGLTQMKDNQSEMLRIMDVDAEENVELAERYQIRSVPTLILFKNGDEVSRCNGFQSTSMLREWVSPHIRN